MLSRAASLTSFFARFRSSCRYHLTTVTGCLAVVLAWMPGLATGATSSAAEAHRQIFAPAPTGAQSSAAGMTAYDGARTCARCHPAAASQVAHSLHYQFKAAAAKVDGQETVLRGVLTDYCGVQGTVASINWLSVVQPSGGGHASTAIGCATCHVGPGSKPVPVGQLTQADYDSIDCLICHAPNYSRTVATVNGQPAFVPAPEVDLIAAVQNVQRPTSDMCLRCHLSAGGGPNFKHGTVPTALSDVHAARGLQCIDCHVSSAHHTAGSGDLKAVDAPNLKVDCAKCHTAAPHKGANAFYNAHTDRVACQTCHIPSVAADAALPTVTERDWTQPTLSSATGLYDAKNTLATNLVPLYRWWNGKLQDNAAGPIGAIADADAKIYPWRKLTVYAPADANNPGQALPLDSASYAVNGDVGQAVTAGAAEINTPYSGRWTRLATDMFFDVQHQVAPASQALKCKDCHTPAGRLDFAALGYASNQVAYLQSTAPWQGWSHVGRFGTSYQGPASCTQCHPGKVEEVMASAHYTMRTTNANIAFPGGGSHGMVDLVSSLGGGSMLANYYADVSPDGASFGCGKCHIGQGLPLPNASTGRFTQSQKDGLDCLICHAADGAYDMNGDGVCDEKDTQATARALLTDPQNGRKTWHQDRSLRAAESVGRRQTAETCLRCHEHGQAASDYKRGTPYDPNHDVHAAAGLLCTDCHQVAEHKIARGGHVSDLHAWERPEVQVSCLNCHGSRPHQEWADNPAFVPYNDHAEFISCQACHIPWVSGSARRIWATTAGITNGPEASVPLQDPVSGLFGPWLDLTPAYATRPVYRWFNGSASMFSEPLHDPAAWDSRVATRATPGAMIYPFRNLVNGMATDARGAAGNPQFNTRFSIAGALDAVSEPLKRLGFMRPEGLTERERAALSAFPNVLGPDLETYQRTGNLREAVNIGMGRTASVLAGNNVALLTQQDLSAAGSNLWSGDILGLDLPDNPQDPTYDSSADPTRVTGSFISVNHAVVRNTAFRCLDCHSRTGVMDFQALSYTPEKSLHLSTLFESVQFVSTTRTSAGLKLRWTTIPGKTYQLESTTDLSSGHWTAIPPARYTISRWLEQVVPSSTLTNSGQVFFRVREVVK